MFVFAQRNSIQSFGVYSVWWPVSRIIGDCDGGNLGSTMYFRHPYRLQAVSVLSGWPQTRRSCTVVGAFALAILCFACVIPAFAQSPDTTEVFSTTAAPSNAASAEKFPVSGTVIDAATGEPIRKALVQINGAQGRTAFTDGDGRFQFEGMPSGPITISAQKQGYFGEQEMPSHTARQVEVGPNSESVVLKLTPEAVIAGKVTTATGTPLEHVPLRLTFRTVREGRRRWDSREVGNTDENGRFRFANLLPGTYYLEAGPITPPVESLFEVDRRPKAGYPSVYYPGVPDLASASPIQLSAGQQAEANFALREVRVYSISGTISGYAPNQGVGILLLNQSETQLPIGVQFSMENGRFDVHGVPAGSYILRAISSLPPNQQIRAEAQLTVTSNLYNLHLALGPAASIPVSVHKESKESTAVIRKGDVRVSNMGPPLAVRLLGEGPGKGDSYSGLEGPPGQQTPILSGVEPGRYAVELIPQGSWYVQSAQYGQTNLLTDDLTLPAGAPPLPIEVVLRNDGGSLMVAVNPRDEKDVPASVVVISERLAKATPRTAYYYPPSDKTSQNEGVTIDSLAPGDYLVLAFDHADGIEYSSPDVLRNYLSQAAHVTVRASQKATVEVDLISTGETSN
jgi:hypothetical protein